MSRKRRTQTPNSTPDERDDFSPSLTQLLRPPKIQNTRPLETFSPPKILKNTLKEIEDRRVFHPQADKRPARSLNRSQHRLVLPKSKPSQRLPYRVQFDAPKQVAICIRRKRRKEVLFAKGKTGKGARARRHRHNHYSEITC